MQDTIEEKADYRDQSDFENTSEFLKVLYKRHYQGALVRSGASAVMWSVAFVAFILGIIKINNFAGITLSVIYLILINPPTLYMLRRIDRINLYRYVSLMINFLEIVGYTAIIYFLGGIEAAYLVPIYAVLITYVGVFSPRSFPYIIAFMSSAALAFVIAGEHYGVLPHQFVVASVELPWPNQLAILTTITGLLFVIAYISSLTGLNLKQSRSKLRQNNIELQEIEKRLRSAHALLESRVQERTAKLQRANERLRFEIAERKKTEAALLDRETLFRNLFEQHAAVQLIIDPHSGKIIDANPSAERFYGWTREQLKQMAIHDINTLSFEEIRKEMGKACAREKTHFEFSHRRADGSIRDVEVFSSKIALEGKELLHSIVHDITDRKSAEQAMIESEAKFRTLVDNSLEGILVLDLQGTVLFLNNAAARTIEADDPKYLIGRNVIEFIAPESIEDVVRDFMEVAQGNDGYLAQYYLITAKGKKVCVESIGKIIQYEGKPADLVSIRDITDRKKAEEERRAFLERLQRAEKMEALGTLAGGVAHDLNNVLGVLVGYSELLSVKLSVESTERRYADNILKSAIRGAAIVDDLLTLARRGVTVSEVVDLNRVISDYFNMPEFEKLKNQYPWVNVKTDLEPGLLSIKGSPIHLLKMLMNLILNAAEAISDDGEIIIRTENRYLDKPLRGYDVIQEGDYVVLMVSDTGKGISSADLDKIFEPFYTKKVMGRSGTGLGLSVVWGTIKDHNGYIDVKSEEGKGSIFTIYLPVTREERLWDHKVLSSSGYHGKGESILVIDDVKEQRELAKNVLERLGYVVTTVSSGEEAIEDLKGKNYDLIVLDMIMDPGIDGMETYRRILEINPEQKAIIASGFSETERVKQTLAMGAGSFIRKPYIMEKMGIAVREELDRIKIV